METYKMLSQYEKDNIIPNIAITVTHHNFHRALEIYEFLKSEHKVTSFSAIAMREQGVVEPIDANIKKSIYEAYSALTKKYRKTCVAGRQLATKAHSFRAC